MSQRLADPVDMLRVVPANALVKILTPQREEFLQSASDEAWVELQRVGVTAPLTSWGSDVRSKVAAIGTYEALAAQGFDSGDLGSSLLRRAEAARAWFKGLTAKPPGVVDSTPETVDDGPRIVTSGRRGW